MAAIFSPFRRSYTYCQRMAHEQPVIFYSLAVGAVGPIAVVVVPEVRKTFFGWKPAERPPTTYPLPNRAREANVEGFEDGWKPSPA
ncbi:n19m, NADH-ubiquinone oxidoreductase 9.5 kDa subunit [Microbotryomycetes sp. JL221]|nr:n19m, NADH-ubiquinone oxidoreductase 9.5 kDa subunit [Microbotryomycetes sp. JL221]